MTKSEYKRFRSENARYIRGWVGVLKSISERFFITDNEEDVYETMYYNIGKAVGAFGMEDTPRNRRVFINMFVEE